MFQMKTMGLHAAILMNLITKTLKTIKENRVLFFNAILFLFMFVGLGIQLTLTRNLLGSSGDPRQNLGGPEMYVEISGHRAFIFPPRIKINDITKWVWYAPTLFSQGIPGGSQQWYFDRLRKNGFAVVGIDAGDSYGNDECIWIFSQLYFHLTATYKITSRAILFGQSRGGLMVYNWASRNPDKVERIAGIYPVCDPLSYPGHASSLSLYGGESGIANHTPLNILAPLFRRGVPIMHIHGDSDMVVPLTSNSQLLKERYSQLGGLMFLKIVHGKGHEEVPEFFQNIDLFNFLTQ